MAPQPYVYPPAPRPSGAARTWWWFLIPLFTFGFASFVMVFVGARLTATPAARAIGGDGPREIGVMHEAVVIRRHLVIIGAAHAEPRPRRGDRLEHRDTIRE